MADPTTDFFQALAAGGPHPDLGKAKGGTRWLIELDNGNVAVSRRNAKADCVVRAEKSLFDRVASGEQNGMAAVLRGAIVLEGDAGLLLPFQRLFPDPPRSMQ